MYTLKALWIKSAGIHDPWSDVPPAIVFYMLRALMFVLSFVLEDWAIQELVTRPKERRVALLLVASSYVTWTWQCHTFSNAVETLVVLWGLVLVQRIAEDKVYTARLQNVLRLDIIANDLRCCAGTYWSLGFCRPRIRHCSRDF